MLSWIHRTLISILSLSCRGYLLIAALLLSWAMALPMVAAEVLREVPDGGQALSLLGKVLYPPAANERSLQNLERARVDYAANPNSADSIIWLGRRTAYAGDYRRAIEVFSEGISKFPDDPRFYRHRGHRYITLREFDLAIADLSIAVQLMQDLPLEVEPDGLPNLQNIALTTTQGNVWYHLGLAYYLKQDWSNALAAFRNGFALGSNDDNRVSTSHWIYMILHRMGDSESAATAVAGISTDMEIIENSSYHQLCLLYRGEMAIKNLMVANGDEPTNAAVAYGLANYYFYNGDRERSDQLLQHIVSGTSWAAFGFIAAEADLANPLR